MTTDNGKQRRRHFTAETKLTAIQEARQGGVPVRQAREKYEILPGQFVNGTNGRADCPGEH